jgi:hypothetical protein
VGSTAVMRRYDAGSVHAQPTQPPPILPDERTLSHAIERTLRHGGLAPLDAEKGGFDAPWLAARTDRVITAKSLVQFGENRTTPGRLLEGRSGSSWRQGFINLALLRLVRGTAMSAIQAKKFNWIRTPTAWQEARAWRARRVAALEQFQRSSEIFLSGLAVAQSDLITGAANLATRKALARIAAETKAKFDSLDKLDLPDSVDKTV